MMPVTWEMRRLSIPPKTYPAPGFEEPGVRSLFFEGLAWQGRPTRVFAWYGRPEGAGEARVPAMVLVHGGGATAFAHWVRMWTARGYAAIAMDTCGCTAGGEHAKRPRHDLGGPGGWGDFEHVDEPIEDQWAYHAVGDVILAHSLIRSFPEVDPDRTGVTGISWGGFLTCLAAAADSRFRFAAPVYGCGFLGESSCWLENFREMGPEKAGKWLGFWDPSHYVPHITIPTLWVSGPNDSYFPLGSLQKTYRLASGPRAVSLRVEMIHGHPEGEAPPEIPAFADHYLKGTDPLPRVGPTTCRGGSFEADFTSPLPLRKFELNFTRDTGPWPDRKWTTVAATADVTAGKVTAPRPQGATAAFFNLTDPAGRVVSSEYTDLTDSPGSNSVE